MTNVPKSLPLTEDTATQRQRPTDSNGYNFKTSQNEKTKKKKKAFLTLNNLFKSLGNDAT